jgi:phenylpyruvate tautomerase PptA (4-oxalocrotonate tautomerase family)
MPLVRFTCPHGALTPAQKRQIAADLTEVVLDAEVDAVTGAGRLVTVIEFREVAADDWAVAGELRSAATSAPDHFIVDVIVLAAVRGTLTNVSAINNTVAMDVRKLTGRNLTVTGCTGTSTYCIETDVGTIDGLTATDNIAGFATMQVRRRITLSNATVTDNSATIGILSFRRIRLIASTVTGHVTDLQSGARPQVLDSTCGTSGRLVESEPSWGVCAGD